jgi:diguanylate cyclase (GGDEF)-like protein
MSSDDGPFDSLEPRSITQDVPILGDAAGTRATLTVAYGPEVGRIYVLGPETTLGRAPECTLCMEDPSVSRLHARIALHGDRWVITDMDSRNGLVVGGERVSTRTLSQGDVLRLGPNIRLRFAVMDEEEERYARALYDSSLRDPLTGVFNRRHLEERLVGELAFAARHGTDLAMAMLDVDHFKVVNDTHGHAAGDRVLRSMCKAISRTIRAEDVLSRYGGEEFVVIARGIDALGAKAMAERIRRVVEGVATSYEGKAIRVTISIGVAALSECPDRRVASHMRGLADERLYRAKQEGRNRVVGCD